MIIFIKFYVPAYMIIFFLFAMVFPSYSLYKRTGINPVTFGKKAETAHDYIGVIFKLIFIAAAAFGILNSFVDFKTIACLDTTIFKVIGVSLSLLSLALIMAAQKTMSDSWRIGIDDQNRTELVTSGAFGYTRNPIFAGMLMVLISLFFIIPAGFMGYLAVLSYLITSIQVRLEEEFLSKAHGKDYIEYKNRVGRFIPRFFK